MKRVLIGNGQQTTLVDGGKERDSYTGKEKPFFQLKKRQIIRAKMVLPF